MSRMVSLMEGTEVMMAGVGCGVPALGSAPLSFFAGAGVPFLAPFSPGSGSGGAGWPRGVVGRRSLCSGLRSLVADVTLVTLVSHS